MKRIMLTVAYDGTNYCGWQIQPTGITVEEVLNRELSRLLKEDIHVLGVSRTDSGVHARGNRWVASIGFKKKNYYLGIYSRLEDAVRARKDAEERIYGEFLKWYYENHPVANNPEGADKALLKKD